MNQPQERYCVVGSWKFRDTVSRIKLAAVAREWALHDAEYLQLHIRSVAKNQVAIGFAYRARRGRRVLHTAFARFRDETSRELERDFGRDFLGWDIASNALVIK